MKIKILSIQVLTSSTRTDSLLLTLDVPNGVYPYTGLACAEIKVGSRMGEEYAKRHFPEIGITVTDIGDYGGK